MGHSMRSWAAVVVVVLGTSACSSSSGTPTDASQTIDGGNGDASAADAQPDLATAMKCTNINLSCYVPTPASGVPICYEYSNADEAKVAEVTTFCDGAQGTVARDKCPPGYSAGCVNHDVVPCENVWYWFPPDLLSQVCGANLILP
jgi:hypothetical protein